MTDLAVRNVRLMVNLARHYAERGNDEIARRCWKHAEWMAGRCGGISGTLPLTSGGYAAIVLEDGYIAFSPLPVRGGRHGY
jgi:hypothetical protein